MEKRTILLVDDNQATHCLLEEALVEIRPELNLLSVTDGEDCLDLLQKKGIWEGIPALPDMILLDLNMPGTDGYSILEKIRNDPSLAQLPVIILSSSSADGDIDRSYRSGANSYVTKPLGFAELKTMLTDLLHYWLDVAKMPT